MSSKACLLESWGSSADNDVSLSIDFTGFFGGDSGRSGIFQVNGDAPLTRLSGSRTQHLDGGNLIGGNGDYADHSFTSKGP
jgi:hypothetical protein